MGSSSVLTRHVHSEAKAQFLWDSVFKSQIFFPHKNEQLGPQNHTVSVGGSLAGALPLRSLSFLYISVISSFCHFVVLT